MWKCISEVSQVVDEKENEKKTKRKAARDVREYKKIRTRKLCVKLEVGRECLKHDEEKGIICKCCVENKQSLVAQNVLKSTRFYIDGCTSFKKPSPFHIKRRGQCIYLHSNAIEVTYTQEKKPANLVINSLSVLK